METQASLTNIQQSENKNNILFEKALYTAKTHTTGGRTGSSQSSDGRLDIILSTPGGPGKGTNPEQLFAAGWSACFIGALGKVASDSGINKLPADTSVDAEIDLCNKDGEYFLQARLNISLPGVDPAIAQSWIEKAQLTCPYSKAIRGNVKTVYNLI